MTPPPISPPQHPIHPQSLVNEWAWAIIPILEIVIGFEFFALAATTGVLWFMILWVIFVADGTFRLPRYARCFP
jgi:uncharacterized membrane protein YdbT with pleckstrin-like domain